MPQPQIRMAVRIPLASPTPAVVPFIIDTGAAFTCIHAIDAIRFFGMTPALLDPVTWVNAKSIGGVGGSSMYIETPATYMLLRRDGQVEVIEGVIRIGELKTNGIPALLGWDLLKLFRLDVHGGDQVISLHRL